MVAQSRPPAEPQRYHKGKLEVLNNRLPMLLIFFYATLLHGQQPSNEVLDKDFMMKESLAKELLREVSGNVTNDPNTSSETSFESITLARTNSLLSFDGFEVTISRNGNMHYRGAGRSTPPGVHAYEIKPYDYAKLCRSIERLGLDRQERQLTSVVWDRPQTILRFQKKDGTVSTISNRGDDQLIEFELLAAYVERLLLRVDKKTK